MTNDLNRLKKQVREKIDSLSGNLRGLSKQIFDNPELGFEEYKANEWLCDELKRGNFEIEKGIGGLETAFLGRCPKGDKDGPTVAFVSEYDALPGVGHACGHNLIASMGLGAGLGLCSVMEELIGQVLVIGTPAEENGGCKVDLIESGIFDEVDLAMMVHPSDKTLVGKGGLGVRGLQFDFCGEAAHASSQPEEGINALDAAIATFNNVNALREHIKESSRIHGIITDGGKAANIVPEHAGAEFWVRAKELSDLETLLKKVKNCAEAGALAAGAELEIIEDSRCCEPIKPNLILVELFRDNLEELGEEIGERKGGMGSTDMGNVSQIVPAIHPYIKIAEEGTPAHSHAFAEAANSDMGYSAMITGAKALAMTGIDVLGDEENLEAIKKKFNEG